MEQSMFLWMKSTIINLHFQQQHKNSLQMVNSTQIQQEEERNRASITHFRVELDKQIFSLSLSVQSFCTL